EIPRENALQRHPRRGAIANEEALDQRRSAAPLAADQGEPQERHERRTLAKVEHQVAGQQRTAGAMAEHDLVHEWIAAHEHLIDLTVPTVRRIVAVEHAADAHIAAL